jgi:hypothetical protein
MAQTGINVHKNETPCCNLPLGESSGTRHGPASSLLCLDVYGIMVPEWLPSQAALTALRPGGALATTLRSQPHHIIHPCV